MKNLLFCFLAFAVLCGCSKDDEPEAFSAIVNITMNGASASPSAAYLYDYDAAKDFDKSYDAMCAFGDSRKLLNADGAEIKAAYSSPTTIGVNTFENVKKGKYMVVAMYKPDGFSFPMYYYYGYSVLNADKNLSSVTFRFTSSSARGEFIKF